VRVIGLTGRKKSIPRGKVGFEKEKKKKGAFLGWREKKGSSARS